jgi:hypothetical protein
VADRFAAPRVHQRGCGGPFHNRLDCRNVVHYRTPIARSA